MEAELNQREASLGEGGISDFMHKPFTLEARYRLSDGEWHWLRSQSQPRWGPDGAHIGFIGVAHDVTVAKQAEADLRGLNDRLEERVAAALPPRLRVGGFVLGPLVWTCLHPEMLTPNLGAQIVLYLFGAVSFLRSPRRNSC